MQSLTGQKVYFPVESLVGLGHFNRAGKIVREMVNANMQVTVSSGSFVDPERFFKGATLETIPTYVFKGANGSYYVINSSGMRSTCHEFNAQSWIDSRTNSHIKSITRIKPDILVSEFWPFDRPYLDPEMTNILDTLKQSDYNKLRISSVRDVLDERCVPDNDREAWSAKIINDYYHAVLVHGDERFIPLDETYNFTDQIKEKLIYTGYVIDDLPERIAPDPRAGTLLVSCGSGVDAEEMILSFLTSWERLLEQRQLDSSLSFVTDRPVHIICGPRFFEGAYNEVEKWADQLSTQYQQSILVEKYRSDFTTLLSKAAFSISLAGYNTTLETLALDVPTLMMPKYNLIKHKIWKSTEQAYRLQRLHQSNIVSYTTPEETQNSKVFAERIVHEITTQMHNNKNKAKLDFSGASNTMSAITKLTEDYNTPKRTVSIPYAARITA